MGNRCIHTVRLFGRSGAAVKCTALSGLLVKPKERLGADIGAFRFGECATRQDVDRAADGIGVHRRGRCLYEFQSSEQRGRDNVERYGSRSAFRGRENCAVDRNPVVCRRETTDHRKSCLSLIVLYRDAGQAAQNCGGVQVGQTADIVLADNIDDTIGCPLRLDRSALGKRLTRDDNNIFFVGCGWTLIFIILRVGWHCD